MIYKKINADDYYNLPSREGKYKVIEYYSNGNIWREQYFINDKYHREDGPTIIWYNKNGNINYERYYLYNKSFSKEDYYSQKLEQY